MNINYKWISITISLTRIKKCTFVLEKILEPYCRKFFVSFQTIFVIHICHSKSHSVTHGPFEIVEQRPCEITLYICTIPVISYEWKTD